MYYIQYIYIYICPYIHLSIIIWKCSDEMLQVSRIKQKRMNENETKRGEIRICICITGMQSLILLNDNISWVLNWSGYLKTLFLNLVNYLKPLKMHLGQFFENIYKCVHITVSYPQRTFWASVVIHLGWVFECCHTKQWCSLHTIHNRRIFFWAHCQEKLVLKLVIM